MEKERIQKVLEGARLESQQGHASAIRKAVLVVKRGIPDDIRDSAVEMMYNSRPPLRHPSSWSGRSKPAAVPPGRRGDRMNELARIVEYNMNPAQARDFAYITRTFVIPILRRQAGFQRGYWMVDREQGRATALTFWADHDSMVKATAELEAFHGAREAADIVVREVNLQSVVAECDAPTLSAGSRNRAEFVDDLGGEARTDDRPRRRRRRVPGGQRGEGNG